MLNCVELDFESEHLEVMQLCTEIFGEEENEQSVGSIQRARSLEVWRDRFHNMNGLLLGTKQSNSEKIVSFMYLYDKSPTQLHVWIAGTCQECRRQGAMSLMFKLALEKASARAVEKVTLNTYPKKFPAMLRLATSKWGMSIVNTLPDGKVCLELPLKQM